MDSVIDEAKDTKFMHTEPTKDPAFQKAERHAIKEADEVDTGVKQPKEPKKGAEEEKKGAPAKKEEEKKKPAAKKE